MSLKYIHHLIHVALLVAGMSFDYNLDSSTALNICHSLFKNCVFPNYFVSHYCWGRAYMHGYCALWKSLFFEYSSTIQLWFNKLVMHIKTCQR